MNVGKNKNIENSNLKRPNAAWGDRWRRAKKKLLVHAQDVKMNVCMLIKIEMLNSITVYLFF